jgi:hypothetical protein
MASLRLPLTTAAANWLVKHDRGYETVASWDVAADGWPPSFAGDPLYVAIIPPDLARVPMGAEAWARSMEKRFDPEELRDWVFVPGLTEDEVWLVHTKRVPTALS